VLYRQITQHLGELTRSELARSTGAGSVISEALLHCHRKFSIADFRLLIDGPGVFQSAISIQQSAVFSVTHLRQ
jgi:hypothetical protein